MEKTKGWFDDIVTTSEPEGIHPDLGCEKPGHVECKHDWLPTGFDFDECSRCEAVSGPGAP